MRARLLLLTALFGTGLAGCARTGAGRHLDGDGHLRRSTVESLVAFRRTRGEIGGFGGPFTIADGQRSFTYAITEDYPENRWLAGPINARESDLCRIPLRGFPRQWLPDEYPPLPPDALFNKVFRTPWFWEKPVKTVRLQGVDIFFTTEWRGYYDGYHLYVWNPGRRFIDPRPTIYVECR